MKKILIILITVLFFASHSLTFSQSDSNNKKTNITPINLSGPRIGATLLSDHYINEITEKYPGKNLNNIVVQFGWHFEHRFFSTSNGATAVSEWVLLVGGFEQEVFIPSVTWLLGYRFPIGLEFGAGPNLSLSGTALVFATGVTIQFEEINLPINFAITTSKSAPRFTLLVGFNLR